MRYPSTTRLFFSLPVLSLWLASLTSSVRGHNFLDPEYHESIRRSLRHDPKLNPTRKRSPKEKHRQLQRVASICTRNPTAFSTSLYVTLIGDGTPFQEDDLNSLLRMSLTAFNQADAATCDTTYRTLTGVSVSGVYYTQELDYIRLRYDVTGSCDGCLPSQLDSGVGPLFGGAEMTISPAGGPGMRRRKLLEEEQQQQQTSNNKKPYRRGTRRIKGRSNSSRRLQKNGKDKEKTSDDKAALPAFTPQQPQTQQQGQPTQVIEYQGGPPEDPPIPVNNPCGCAMSNSAAVVLRGPTPSEFGIQLNTLISSARIANTLSGVTHVQDLFEAGVTGQSTVLPSSQARQVAGSCSATNSREFVSTLWLEVVPSNQAIQALQESEWLPMEVAILESYNEMSLVSCDLPFFRTMSDVSYQESRRSGDKLQMRFDVTAKCVNCDPNTLSLFDDPLSGSIDVVSIGRSTSSVLNVTSFRAPPQSLLISEIDRLQAAQSGPIMVFREVTPSCACPLNTGELPHRSPSAEEFTQVLQSSVNTLVSTNHIFSFQTLVRVEEGEMDAVCSSEPQTFVSTVLADFDGSPENLVNTEINTLEGGFKDTYNQLIYESCDEYFRSITGVRLIPGIGVAKRKRSLQATSVGNAANSSDIPDLQSEAPSVYMVTGSCRGCPRSPAGTFSLVDDSFRFRKLMEGGEVDEAAMAVPFYNFGSVAEAIRGFKDADTAPRKECVGRSQRRLSECVCAPGTTSDTPFAPSTNDFRLKYNTEIERFNEEGTVTNVRGVTAMLEVPPGIVSVGFSIFYGTLLKVGGATPDDYPPLVATTTAFYRQRLIDYYYEQALSLRAVNIKWESSEPRDDVNMLRVDFIAELIFEDTPNLPTGEQVSFVMEQLNYVDYITQHVWALDDQESIFRQSHSVRFAGSEALLVDMSMMFTVRADRTEEDPNTQDRDGLKQQVNRFFLDQLRLAGYEVISFTAHIDAEDIQLIQAGSVLVDFDSTILFSLGSPMPTQAEVESTIRNANLELLRTQYLGTSGPVGTNVFTDSFAITFGPP